MSNWLPDGTGVQPGGHVGGDVQASESYSVRYLRRDRPGAAVATVYFYTEDRCVGGGHNHDPGRHYGVMAQTELIVCTDPADPGSTEIWCDHLYQPDHHTYDTPDEAEQAARGAAERHRADQISWDGLAPWETRR